MIDPELKSHLETIEEELRVLRKTSNGFSSVFIRGLVYGAGYVVGAVFVVIIVGAARLGILRRARCQPRPASDNRASSAHASLSTRSSTTWRRARRSMTTPHPGGGGRHHGCRGRGSARVKRGRWRTLGHV
jgi:hypothetical protein